MICGRARPWSEECLLRGMSWLMTVCLIFSRSSSCRQEAGAVRAALNSMHDYQTFCPPRKNIAQASDSSFFAHICRKTSRGSGQLAH